MMVPRQGRGPLLVVPRRRSLSPLGLAVPALAELGALGEAVRPSLLEAQHLSSFLFFLFLVVFFFSFLFPIFP